jgi:protein-arginine kinase activator protein McsA
MDFDAQEYDLIGAWRVPEQDTNEPVCPKCGKEMRFFAEQEVMVCRQCYGSGPEEEWEDW